MADLEDSRKQDPPPIQNLTLDNSVIVRFVKFELLEYWGNLGGGLQYFKVMTGWPKKHHIDDEGELEIRDLNDFFRHL